MLNRQKFNNYAFFCPVSRLHLTVSSPVGFASEVTPAISRALKTKTILDVDGVVDIETGTVKKAQEKSVAPAQNEPAETPAQNEPKNEEKAEPKVEEKVEEKAPEATEEKPKKNSKKNAKADAE